MLEHTFIHLPNFGPRRERRLWEIGVRTWDDFLERFGASQFHRSYCSAIASSKYALKLGDPEYFATLLPSSQTWRSFPHFKRIAYLDIETTGLGPDTDYVTVIGVFDGHRTHSYVHGYNLGDFASDIENYDMVVTFNGSMFDLPFLRKAIKGVRLPNLHIDLRFLLASLNVRGGLKRIETQFGMEREDDLKGLTGYDAVLLWQAYKRRNDKSALDKLVRYNAADISNLKKLTEWAYAEKRKRTGFDDINAKA
ncbi:MAG: ribonuclease H-like domain-containing protein [Candidatus ainarchaeum sp.]|nr:ribonuclease H-like domain-containing protein [Candidatus ainarchaeum sp.]